MSNEGEALVRRFFEELWNEWRLETANELLTEDLRFRGSLGSTAQGREAFIAYVESVRAAFPDWHSQVDDLFSAGDRVAARLTWTGTHRGPLKTVAPTGNKVSYVGVGLFRVADGRIAEAWIVGDTQELWRALGKL